MAKKKTKAKKTMMPMQATDVAESVEAGLRRIVDQLASKVDQQQRELNEQRVAFTQERERGAEARAVIIEAFLDRAFEGLALRHRLRAQKVIGQAVGLFSDNLALAG